MVGMMAGYLDYSTVALKARKMGSLLVEKRALSKADSWALLLAGLRVGLMAVLTVVPKAV